MADVKSGLAAFVAKLERHERLDPAETAALTQAAASTRTLAKSECLARQGDATGALSILCQGLAIAYKTLSDGRQQNLAIFAPGDMLDCASYVAGVVDVSICALTQITVAQIPYVALDSLIERRPALGRGLWRDRAATHAIAREWMVGMGRRSANENVAHRLCELFVRLKAVNLATQDTCEFPFTQIELSDTLGLSVVHVNRVLQHLKRAGLIRIERGKLIVRDWDGLVRTSGFDPAYLELTPAPVRSAYPRRALSPAHANALR